MAQAPISIIQAIDDIDFFKPWFKDKKTWRNWRVYLKALFALQMSPLERKRYRKFTGRKNPPTSAFNESWIVVGRRGGKSFVLALIAVFISTFIDWTPHLARGERGTCIIIATDRKQARTIFRYIEALLLNIPSLSNLIRHKTRETIELTIPINIEIHTASFRATRGYTIIACLLDEIAFWRSDESANPDKEILTALRPSMATVPGSIMVAASSPYARKGVLYEAHQRHFGVDGSKILIWQGTTRQMNKTVPKAIIDEAMEADEASAKAEYMAEFRKDVETFVDKDVVDSCVMDDVQEIPWDKGNSYHAFTDPSGGVKDSFTLCIAHRDEQSGFAVIDCIREVVPPFSPDQVVMDFAKTLKDYRLDRVTGDAYAGEWPKERFLKHGITYERCTMPKSDLYKNLLPFLNSGTVLLLALKKLLTQLMGLERATGRGGKDQIQKPKHLHDDIINAVAGAVAGLGSSGPLEMWLDLRGSKKHPKGGLTEEQLQELAHMSWNKE